MEVLDTEASSGGVALNLTAYNCLSMKLIDQNKYSVSDKELFLYFYTSSAKQKPDQIIIFRDGVSESQFDQVLNIKLDQIIEKCKFLDDKWCPNFLVIIAHKNRHMKFFQPGPLIMLNRGQNRQAHYHVLYDEIGFSADDLQELVHFVSYVWSNMICTSCCYSNVKMYEI